MLLRLLLLAAVRRSRIRARGWRRSTLLLLLLLLCRRSIASAILHLLLLLLLLVMLLLLLLLLLLLGGRGRSMAVVVRRCISMPTTAVATAAGVTHAFRARDWNVRLLRLLLLILLGQSAVLHHSG